MTSQIKLLDFPNEILLIIFEKLQTIDALYSLMDVNRRFDRLALTCLDVHDLDMTNGITLDSVHEQTLQVDSQVLSRICEQILPRIRHRVHKLTVERHLMKQILFTTNYPQLYSLSLVNFQESTIQQHLTDDLILRDLLAKQITHLSIDMEGSTDSNSTTAEQIFALVLASCEKLMVLDIGGICSRRACGNPLYLQTRNGMSSTLVELKINIENFADCLYLLDGRLPCLAILDVQMLDIKDRVEDIDEQTKLPQLKSFSLTLMKPTFMYESRVVPLLCRMINLEQLALFIYVLRFDSLYIDGLELYEAFLIYMTQLKKFIFYINTFVLQSKPGTELQSNEDIQRSFIGRNYNEVVSDIKIMAANIRSRCHIYTLPFEFDRFIYLDNAYQSGQFHQVRLLKMSDSSPFESNLFQLISQDFPVLQSLFISNKFPQSLKQDSATIITFPYLKQLNVYRAHDDYAAQFLLKRRTFLPCLVDLCVRYESLTTMTNNFTTDREQYNFSQLKTLDVGQAFVHSENVYQYFLFR